MKLVEQTILKKLKKLKIWSNDGLEMMERYMTNNVLLITQFLGMYLCYNNI